MNSLGSPRRRSRASNTETYADIGQAGMGLSEALSNRLPWRVDRDGDEATQILLAGDSKVAIGLAVTIALGAAWEAREGILNERRLADKVRPGPLGRPDMDRFIDSLASWWSVFCEEATKRGRPRKGRISFNEFAKIAWSDTGGREMNRFNRRLIEKSALMKRGQIL